MVYGMQKSPLTPCCTALLVYLQEGTSTKVREMQHVTSADYARITTPQERCNIELLSKRAESLNTEHNPTHDQLAQNLQKTIETLWERYHELYVSSK